MERAARRLDGDYREDEWGFDEEFADLVLPFLDFLYDRWWRVETVGATNVPGHGRALMVANHAGILPWDATMISMGLLREHPLPRYPRFLVLDWAFSLPWVSVAIRKVGGVAASPFNALRLLEQDQLVAVFPEGVKGTGKPFRERYRLQRFGRGGFVELALRTGAPIVPVAVVGSEEIYPKLGRGAAAGARHRRPLLPADAAVPVAGPRRGGAAAQPLDDRVLRADAHRPVRPRRRRRPLAGPRALRAGARHDPGQAAGERGAARPGLLLDGPRVLAVSLALGCSVCYGVSNFLGPQLAKRQTIVAVLVLSQVAALVACVVYVVAAPGPALPAGEAVTAAVAGAGQRRRA